MAFGQSMTNESTSNEDKVFENFRVDLKTPGTRLIRLFPTLDENDEFSGRGETATETKFAEIWWKFNVGGKEAQRQIITSWEKAYKNPVYAKICEIYEDDDKNKPKPRMKFAVNVWDRSPCVVTEKGIAILNSNREFVLADGSKVKGTPQPMNKVRVLEGSGGKNPSGKHMLASLAGLYGTVEIPNEDLFAEANYLFLHEFDIKIKVDGLGKEVTRSFFPGDNREPLSPQILAQPKYNLTEWLTPWPDEMLQRLVDGEDYNELCKEYKITRFPRLIVKTENEAEFE